MTPNFLAAIIGALVATSATIASALVFIISSSKAAGRREGKLDDALDKLKLINLTLAEIPEIKARLAQYDTLIYTIVSDVRELKGRVTVGGEIRIRPRSPSSPKFGDEDDEL